jgi:hypothetical protein
MLDTKLVLSALGIALLATPAFAQNPHRQSSGWQTTEFESRAHDGDAVLNGRIVGRDPDVRIRGELVRNIEPIDGD